jgi:adenylate cyclase, class 2
MEIEAIDIGGNIGKDKLYEQCTHYLKELGIADEDLLSTSYSDLLMENKPAEGAAS